MTNYIEVMPHTLAGYEWTIGHVGVILGPAHTKDFAIEWGNKETPIRKGWHSVSVENPNNRGGYAFATLPMEYLAPHHCTTNCPKHIC